MQTEGDGVVGSAPVWLITGCSSGLGFTIAAAAADAGARVVATARRTEALAPLVASAPDRIEGLQLDVTNYRQAEAVVAEVEERFGGIDVLVNNAGRVHLGATEEITDEELRAVFELHVFAPTHLVRTVLPGMRRRGGGTIVQMSTKGAFLITPGFGAYTASKAALEGISATLATEVADHGIRVLIVEPGSHRTSVFADGTISKSNPDESYASTVGTVREFIDGVHGTQSGDPDKAARAIVDVVESGEGPLRLPLGGDAVDEVRDALRKIEEDYVAWEDFARSTSFDPVRGSE
ncbi:MAG TPA: SDR family NAD(P)-dependent oxidoreductase [Solirubrobacterales bacterium]|nr:SDR family NAD(P)-dependent oxidoreductase [Solirubrobacterales bacterium]